MTNYLITLFFNHKTYFRMSAITDKVKGNWNVVKGKIKEEYAELTDDDLTYEEGQEDQLLGRIQRKTGKTKEQIKDWIDSL